MDGLRLYSWVYRVFEPDRRGDRQLLNIKRLSLDEAKILTEGAEEKSREIEVPMCIAVADESRNLVAFTRMDGAKILSIAIDKAFTGGSARKGTHEYNQLCVPGQPTFGIHVTKSGAILDYRRRPSHCD